MVVEAGTSQGMRMSRVCLVDDDLGTEVQQQKEMRTCVVDATSAENRGVK